MRRAGTGREWGGCASGCAGRYPGGQRSVPWIGRDAGYIAAMSDATITPKPNGPLVVQGPVRILAPDGRDIPVPPRKDGRPAEVVVLCRCGGAAPKPVFDGTHKGDGFTDPPPPPP